MSPWVKLGAAIALEVAATLALRQSAGLTNPWWTAATVVGYVISFWLLAQITDQLEIGTIYAIWSGVGTAVVAIFGIWAFREDVSPLKVIGIVMIIGGAIALNLAGGGHGDGAAPREPSARGGGSSPSEEAPASPHVASPAR